VDQHGMGAARPGVVGHGVHPSAVRPQMDVVIEYG